MPKAIRRVETKTVERVVLQEENVVEITLVLTAQEAVDLWQITGCVVGPSKDTARATSDALYLELSRALGTNYTDHKPVGNNQLAVQAGTRLNADAIVSRHK